MGKVSWLISREAAKAFGLDYDMRPGFVFGEEPGPYIKHFG